MAQMKTTYFYPISDILLNPGMGFKTFQRFNGDLLNEGTGWTEGFPIEYQRDRGTLDTPEFPRCTLSYYRLYWRFLEPEKGKFNWELLDKAFYYSRMRGQTLYLRIPAFGPKPESDVPDWFRQMVGPRDESLPSKWVCDPEDERYIQHYGDFVRAVAARYDGHPDLECVDIGIIGFWGEGEGTELVSFETRKKLMDAYLDGFKNTLLVIQPTERETAAYSFAKRPDLGWRIDCLGDMRRTINPDQWCHMLDLYPQQIIECGLQDVWKTGPVSLEACGVMQAWFNRGYDVDYIIEQSLKWHISNFNNKSSRVPPEWQPSVNQWLKKMGYRLAPRKVTFSGEVAPGGKLGFDAWVENMGVAPCYRAYPLTFRFVYDNGEAPFTVATDVDIRTWLPGDSLVRGEVTVPRNLPEGTCKLQWALVNPFSDKPCVQFATNGREQDGWYTLGTIDIKAEG
nr:DUF4832 domain-containing protein [bacterium]